MATREDSCGSRGEELNNFATQFKKIGNIVTDNGNLILKSSTGEELGRIINGRLVISDAQIIQIPKGYRPEPELYMTAEEIAKHNNLFEKEGAGFIVIKSWTEAGNPIYNTLPSRKFVGLRSEMDAVILKYKTQGNDWTVLRDELNLGSNTNLASEEIYYIKISGSDTRFSFELPNGNESGAIIGEWIPGGYTRNGTAEAVLIGSENIVHNKNINQLLNNFTGMWEKIK